jgi:hypothetical protein
MAIENFKPTIWSDLIFKSYDKNFVFSQLANREYEGEISAYGDQVKINEIGNVTVNSYSGSITYEELDDASKYLLINQKKYSAVKLDDVDNVQSKPKVMGEATRKMGVAHADDVDSHIAGLYTEAGITSGSTASPTSITSVNVTSQIRAIGTSMSDNKVPKDRRVAVLPPWLIAKIDLANVVRNTDNPFIMNNAYVGRFMGFDLFESQNINASGTTWYAPMFFRANDTIAHAEQLVETEALRAEGAFEDKVRNLMVYGSKVVRPDSLAVLYCSEGSESTI